MGSPAGCYTHGRVLCTWQLLGLAVKEPWLVPSGPCCMNRHRKRYSRLLGGSFLAGKAAWALSGYLPTSADYCMLVNEWAWLGE